MAHVDAADRPLEIVLVGMR